MFIVECLPSWDEVFSLVQYAIYRGLADGMHSVELVDGVDLCRYRPDNPDIYNP